jgi:hypothetical protein
MIHSHKGVSYAHANPGEDQNDGHLALHAAIRYMVTQRFRRNILFSTQNALKLQRDEALNEETEE